MQNEANQTYSILTCCRFARRRNHRSCVKLHQWLTPSSLLCFMHRFLKGSRAENQQEVSSVSGEVILSHEATQPLSARLQGSLRLLPFPLPASPSDSSCDGPSPCEEPLRAYPVPLK